jgi:streptogramin lyase
LRVSPNGPQKTFKVGLPPVGIATDGRGNLWFTNERLLNTVGRFNPKDIGVLDITLSDYTNGGIILGGDGNIWVSQVSHLAKITPEGQFTEYATPYTFGSLVWANDRVWFITNGGLSSLNPADGKVDTYRAYSIENPGGMVTTNGYLYAMGKRLVQFDLKTKSTATYIPPSRFIGAGTPQDLALAPDGSLWYAAQRLDRNLERVVGGGVVRFDPSTHHFTAYASPDGVPWNWGLTVAPNGKIWATASDVITVLDPSDR